MTIAVAALMGITLSAPGLAIDPLPITPDPPDPSPTAIVTVTTYPPTGSCPIPCYVIECESGGDYNAENDYSTASGKYQIVDGTWAGYGGYSHASDAPPEVQDAKARELYAGGAGASHWEQCL